MRRAAVCVATLACLPGVAVSAPLAIRAAKLVPVSSSVIDNGTIVIDNGKIVALGPTAELRLPDGCEVLDAGDRWVMPGMVEPHTHIATNYGFNDMVQPLNPELRIADSFDPSEPALRHCVEAGVTTINTVPGSGTSNGGFGVIAKTHGTSADEMILKRIGIMKFAQAFNPERRSGDLGLGWMGMSWYLRQMMQDAKAYHEACTAFEEGRGERPKPRPELDLIRHTLRGDCVVFNHTYSPWGVMMTARMFGDELGLKTLATHTAFGGYKVGSEIAKRPNVAINVGPRVAEFRSTRERRIVGHAVAFAEAGVENVSLNTDAVGYGTDDQLYTQATASAHLGMDDALALAAITLNPARALGIDDRVGSLEVGKDADLVIKQGSLVDVSTPIDLVLVGGKIAFQRKEWRP